MLQLGDKAQRRLLGVKPVQHRQGEVDTHLGMAHPRDQSCGAVTYFQYNAPVASEVYADCRKPTSGIRESR
jgi:hypothetical protein